jgi:O-antigen/teichoic acid export membrane protein
MNFPEKEIAAPRRSLFQAAAAKLGIDRAVRWTLLTQSLRFLTGPITMFLMVHFLTPEIQGYAYTFGGVLALSIFLEMGFSQNILQFASHEYSHLQMDLRRRLSGNDRALSRLVSLGRLSFKYYGIAAVVFFILLSIGGRWFFQTSDNVGVSWSGPWYLACVAAALTLAINPCWALIEGCNQIAEIEKFRFYSSLATFAAGAIGLVCGLKLYAIVLPAVMSVIIAATYLLVKWKYFFKIFLNHPTGEIISWKKEIWPFQWRIAISWISGYFIFSLVTPVVFRTAGAAEAGRFGFTMQLVKMIATIASSWSTTKLPLYGILVAQRDWHSLNKVWRKASYTTFIVNILGSIGLLISMELASQWYPKLASRYTGPMVALVLCSSVICQSAISSWAYYLRAFKAEPFMRLSVITALISLIIVPVGAKYGNMPGASFAYTLAIFSTVLPAYLLFNKKRSQFTVEE